MSNSVGWLELRLLPCASQSEVNHGQKPVALISTWRETLKGRSYGITAELLRFGDEDFCLALCGTRERCACLASGRQPLTRLMYCCALLCVFLGSTLVNPRYLPETGPT